MLQQPFSTGRKLPIKMKKEVLQEHEVIGKGEWLEAERVCLNQILEEIPYCQGGEVPEQVTREAVDAPSLAVFKARLDVA